MSVQAETDWRDPDHVYYQAVYGLDLLNVPEHQVNELYAYCNAVSNNLQQGNVNFNNDQPCAVCGQARYSFDDCSFLAQHEHVCEAYLWTWVALN